MVGSVLERWFLVVLSFMWMAGLLVALSGCAYTPPDGFSASEVDSCKGDFVAGRAAMVAMAFIPFVGAIVTAPPAPPRDAAINQCLYENRARAIAAQ